MPELPEVEQIRRSLSPKLVGQKISAVRVFYPQRILEVSPVEFRRRLKDAKVKKLTRRGKCLLFHLDSPYVALVGLGMTGYFCVESDLEPLDYLIMGLGIGRSRFVKLYDVRRFCRLSVAESSQIASHPFLRYLGFEYDDKRLTPKVLRRELGHFRSKSIKEVLMEQGVIAGIGNIYANEILHAARLSPTRAAPDLRPDECSILLGMAQKVLRRAVELGGTTVRNFCDADGKAGRYTSELKIYLRDGQPCARCGKGSNIQRIMQAGRSTFYCPRCQK